MKRENRGLALVVCISLLAGMAMGCGSSSPGEGKEETGTEASNISTEPKDESSGKSEAGEKSKAVTIEEQVVYDANDIKITANGLDDGLFGTELKLLIENDSDKGITVQADNANVNGFMVDTMMSADVAAGKKANTSLTFETSGLKDCGIESIADMEFGFHIFDSETWDDIDNSEPVSIETSIASTYTQSVDDSGDVLVDENGIKVISKGLSADDSFWGPGVILYIENNSDKNITVQARDVSVNGFMVDSSMSEDVVAGKKAMSAVQFFSTDLEKNSITDITDVELYFSIIDQESWDTIMDSDVINLKF